MLREAQSLASWEVRGKRKLKRQEQNKTIKREKTKVNGIVMARHNSSFKHKGCKEKEILRAS